MIACSPTKLACLLFALASPLAAGTGDTSPISPRFEQGRLWLVVDQQPLDRVLTAVAERAGFTVELNGDLTQTVSHRFEGVPLGDALDELTSKQIAVTEFAAPPCEGGARPVETLRVYANSVGSGSQEQPVTEEELVDELQVHLAQAETLQARQAAVNRLAEIASTKAVDVLANGMPGQEHTLREEIIDVFIGIGGVDGTRALGRVLTQEPDSSLRAQALEGLGYLVYTGTHEATIELEAARQNSHEDVREGAKAALAEIGD